MVSAAKIQVMQKWLVVWVGGLEVWEVRVMCNIKLYKILNYIVLYSFI